MVTGTRARTYEEMVDALAEEGLPALQAKLSDLTSEDWERPTLLQPPRRTSRRGRCCSWPRTSMSSWA
jgi:hypothetical protein